MYRYIKVFVFCCSFNLTQAQFVLNTVDGLPNLGRSCSVWADFNNDGLLDVAISGINDIGGKEAGIYFNNNNGSFSNSGVFITAVSDGDMAVNDYDQDGWIDLVLIGVNTSGHKVTALYKNEGSGVFTLSVTIFEGLAYGGISFEDFNSDGKPDIIANGLNNENHPVCLLYLNDGNESFTVSPTSITATGYGDLVVLDFNNDSYLDVLISGLNANNQRVTSLFENKGNVQFIKKEIVLPALRSGGLSTADVNNDGYTDLFISGSTSGANNHTAIYRNNAGEGFVLLKTLPAVSDGSGVWGDYNHDGYADLAMFGFDKTTLITKIYENSAGTDFIDSGIALPGTSKGIFAWGDYTRDNRLDFLLSGYASVAFTSVYENTLTSVNTLPSAPTNLSYTAYADSIVLSWDVALDHETSSNGLTYAVYIGSSTGTMDVMHALSDISTGIRKVSGNGVIKHNSLVLPKMPEGIYYWSVQAIDPSFGVSPFAIEETFISCLPISITGTEKVCTGSSLSLDVGTSQDHVQWFSFVNNNLIGSNHHLDHVLRYRDTLAVQVTKNLGCTLYDTLIVDVFPLPNVEVEDTKSACLNDEITLEVQTNSSIIKWFENGNDANIIATQQQFVFLLTTAIDLVVQVQDEKSCVNTDTVHLSVYPQPVVDLGEDRFICIGEEFTSSTGTGRDHVNWFSLLQGKLIDNNVNVTIQVTENDQLWAEVKNQEGCVGYDTIQINALRLPDVNAGEDKMICENAHVTIGEELHDVSNFTFLWTPSFSLNASDIPNPIVSPTEDTEYVLSVRDENNCENRDTVWVYLNQPSIINAGQDASICIGDEIFLGGNPTASGSDLEYTFNWSPSVGLDNATLAQPKVSPLETTTYFVEVMAGNCSAGSASITITVHDLPHVYAGEDFTVGFDETASLVATGAQYYEWFPEELFDNATLPDPVVYPNRTTQYWVIGTDMNGCSNKDTVKVIVRSELFVPNLFTPNDDNVNDIFRAHGFGVEYFSLKVYDRWGRLLFESSDIENGWDGRNNGQYVESGNYTWTVQGYFYDGTSLHSQGQQRGIIKLVR